MTDVEAQQHQEHQTQEQALDEKPELESEWENQNPDAVLTINSDNFALNSSNKIHHQNLNATDCTEDKGSPNCPQVYTSTDDTKNNSNGIQENSTCGNSIGAGADVVPDPEKYSTGDLPESKDTPVPLSPYIEPDMVTNPDEPKTTPKEHVFEITMEEDYPNKNNKGNQGNDVLEEEIYYLPLAVGSSAVKPNTDLTDFSGLVGKNSSENVLRDLGIPLAQMAESINIPTSSADVSASSESIATGQSTSRPQSQIEATALIGGSSSSTLNFLTPNSTLVTENLIKTGSIPDSITHQFNQIAKLNKSSLRSRRTVRTTTTRVQPGQLISAPVSSIGDVRTTTASSNQSTSDIPSASRSAQGIQSQSDSTTSPQSSLFIHADSKRPIHARFYSDETQPMTDFGSPIKWQSNPASGDEPSPVSNTNPTVPVVASISRQPVSYMRSVTAERLPVFVRSGDVGATGTGVLRSKSAACTIPANRRVASGQIQESTMEQGVTEAHRSLPDSSLGSQCHSSGHTGSEEGSTSSLPSLSTGGSSSTGVPITLENQRTIPAGSDPGLNAETTSKDSVDPTAVSPLKLDVPTQGDANSVAESEHATNDTYSKLLKRRHIMKELIQVEKEYVGALATLVNSYMIPLKQEKVLDDQQIETIFYKINELFNYHMSFLNTLQMWEQTNTVGDKLLDMFSREAVATCYCSFVENFPNSEKTLETCWNTKSSFQKFCELKVRTMRSKLPLKALLVQPIQRIPRYELLVKRLIEHTPPHFSDNALLIEARNAIHRLAVRVNTVQADGQDESLVEGTRLLDRLLAPATLTPNRAYIRHDIVSLEDRKDPVCIFMFTDQIVFTVAKRRGTQMIKKPIFLRLQSPKGVDTIENIKYKIFHRLGIEAIEIEHCDENETERLVQHRESRDKKDLTLLAEIENISTKLDHRHHELDNVVRNLYQSVQQDLEDLRSARYVVSSVPKNLSVITATMKEGIERYELTFPTSEKRNDWERTIMELKRQLSSVKRTSRFFGSLEVPRTLSGIQLSCAAVVEIAQLTKATPRDVWICAADGYTGYICLLTLHPRPMICLNTPLSGCNSRITCICAVPGLPIPSNRRVSSNHGLTGTRNKSSTGSVQPLSKPRTSLSKSDDTMDVCGSESTDRTKSENTAQQFHQASCTDRPLDNTADENKASSTPQSSRSQLDDDSETLCHVRTQTSNSPIYTPPDTPTLKEVDSESACSTKIQSQQTDPSDPAPVQQDHSKQSSYFSREVRCSSEPSLQEMDSCASPVANESIVNNNLGFVEEQETLNSDLSDSSELSDADNGVQVENISIQTEQAMSKSGLIDSASKQIATDGPSKQKGSRLIDPYRPTMWLGTEEGTIFIFYATDNIKTSRQRQQVKLSSAINSILQLDVRIFVACTNGDFLVYDRNSDGLWDVDSPRMLTLNPDQDTLVVVRRMLAVAGNIWCAAHRYIYVLNSVTLKVELSFPLNGNPADPRGILLMAYGNQTVWLATENSPRVSLYHATTGEFLMEIDLKPIVIQSLQHCDEIIMRHKEACLRITCLTVCKDLLWAGTSAGAIVTVAIPRVSLASTRHSMEPPQLEVLKQGHIGQVRFLVSLESAADSDASPTPERSRVKLSPMRETATTLKLETQRDEPTNDSKPIGIEEKTTSDPVGRPVSSNEDNKAATSESTHSTPTVSIPQPPPRPKPPALSHLQQAARNEPRPRTDSKSDDAPSAQLDHRFSISPHHRHYLLGVRRPSVNPCTTIATQMKVISGGDGLEEFITSELVSPHTQDVSSNMNLGDDDSTNQILIWDVH